MADKKRDPLYERIFPDDDFELDMRTILAKRAAHETAEGKQRAEIRQLLRKNLDEFQQGHADAQPENESGGVFSLYTRHHDPDPVPPRWGQSLLVALLPRDAAEATLGDLHEEFVSRAADDLTAAEHWYRWQIVKSAAPLVWRGLVKLVRFLLMVEQLLHWFR